MDPLTVLTTLWRHKWLTLPVIVLTIAACVYVYLYAPRSYEANVSYALTAPDVPSSLELERDPDLARLNSDNPYLRSNDSSLLAQVVITKLSDPAYIDQLKEAGFSTDFRIAPVASLGMGLVTVNAISSSEAEAVATAKLVGEQFTSTLYSVQKINRADDRYLYSPILVRGPGPAKELFSNRLRALIMVGIAGSVLLFGSVSIARARALRRQSATVPGPVTAKEPADALSLPDAAKPEGQPVRTDRPGTRRSMRGTAAPVRAHEPADPTTQLLSTRVDVLSKDISDNIGLVSAGERIQGR